MKYILFLLLIVSVLTADAQNVGIGTNTPLMKLHVAKNDSSVALLENIQALNTSVSNGLYFKTGSSGFPYTGAVKTIGQTASTARLSFFTFASSGTNGLLERMSITDAGLVGIGNNAPQSILHINPAGAGSLLIGTNKSTGGYTNIEMGISSQSNGYGYIQSIKQSGTAYGDLILNQNGGRVGIGTNFPQATLDVNGGIALPIKVVTADYTVQNGDYTIVVNKQFKVNNDINVYLPNGTTAIGRIIKIVLDSLPNTHQDSYVGDPGEPFGKVNILDAFGLIQNTAFKNIINTHYVSGSNWIDRSFYHLDLSFTFQYDGTKWYLIDHVFSSFEDKNYYPQ